MIRDFLKKNNLFLLNIYGVAVILLGWIVVLKLNNKKSIIFLREIYLKFNCQTNQMLAFIELQNIGLMAVFIGFITIILIYLMKLLNVNSTKSFFYIAIVNFFTLYYFLNCYVCDDAFITFRTVDNFIHGYGLRWNTIERVQTFTNPLWMFLISFFYFFINEISHMSDTQNMYIVSMSVSYFASLSAILILSHRFVDSKKYINLLIILALLFSSKAFVEYTSSGLENPLTYLFIILFYTLYFHDDSRYSLKKLIFYFMVFSLAFFNRNDSLLLFIFPVLGLFYEGFKKNGYKIFYSVLIGLSPAYLWILFSIVYFGSPLPNSYYAKLSIGSSPVVLKQGINFIFNVLVTDPITVLGIIFAICLMFFSRKYLLYSFSLLLYLLYIIKTGGDFMGGRFLSSPYLLSTIVITEFLSEKITATSNNDIKFKKAKKKKKKKYLSFGFIKEWGYLLIGIVIIYNIIVPLSPLKTPYHSEFLKDKKIGVKLFNLKNSLENIYQNFDYYYSSNLLYYSKGGFPFGNVKFHSVNNCSHCRELRKKKEIASIEGGGLLGFCKGHGQYLIDPQIITDPLLARLPMPDISKGFVPGHIKKKIPDGLLESYINNKNMIKDENLKEYYNKIFVVTRGKLFTKERFKYIYELNFTKSKRYTRDYN